MRLALSVHFVEVEIAFLVEHFQVGRDGRISGFRLFVVLQDVPRASRSVDVPKDVHHLELNLGECVVIAFHILLS